MGFIYKVTCKVNGKVYIGLTQKTVEERWKEHKRAVNKSKSRNYKLYKAIRKHSIENFELQIIEEVDDFQTLIEREKYWIQFYDSYKNGYNSTIGGEGNLFVNRDQILQLHQEGLSIIAISKALKIDRHTVSKILRFEFKVEPNKEPRQPRCDYKRILELHKQGLSSIKISEITGNEKSTVRSILSKYGLEDHPHLHARLAHIDFDLILRLHNEGLPPWHIYKETGVAPSATVRFLASKGLIPNKMRFKGKNGQFIDYQKILELYQQGHSKQKICEMMDVSITVVYKATKQNTKVDSIEEIA